MLVIASSEVLVLFLFFPFGSCFRRFFERYESRVHVQEFGSCTVNVSKYQSDDQIGSKDLYVQPTKSNFLSCSPLSSKHCRNHRIFFPLLCYIDVLDKTESPINRDSSGGLKMSFLSNLTARQVL